MPFSVIVLFIPVARYVFPLLVFTRYPAAESLFPGFVFGFGFPALFEPCLVALEAEM